MATPLNQDPNILLRNSFVENGDGTTSMQVTATTGGTDQDVNLVTVDGDPIALGQALEAASLPVVLASDAALPAGDNNIGNVDIASAIPAGANVIGSVSINQTTPGTTNRVGVAVSTGAGTEALLRDTTQFGDGLSDGVGAIGLRNYNPATAGYDRSRGYFPFTHGVATADTQIAAGAAFLHSINVSPTAAATTAGLITVYDSTTESGTVVAQFWCPTNDTVVKTFLLDSQCTTGIYVGFDATVTAHTVSLSYVLTA